MEKSTIAAVKKVLPLGGRLKLAGVRTSKNRKVKRSPVTERSRQGGDKEEKEEKDEDEEKEIDLREIINKKNKKNSERYLPMYMCSCVFVPAHGGNCFKRAVLIPYVVSYACI